MTETPPRRAALTFIFLTMTLDILALGIAIPVTPILVTSFLNGDTVDATRTSGHIQTLWALMQFFSSPIMGALSDRFGRRPIILLSNLGLGLDYLLLAFAPNLAWLVVGRAISGIASATISTSSAYIADVTPQAKRAAAFGIIGISFGIGFVVGPALAAILGQVSPRLPFFIAASLSLANFLYGTFILPESLPKEKRTSFVWAKANPIGSFRLLKGKAGLLGLALVVFLYQLAHQVYPSIFVLYAMYRFKWGIDMVGYTLAAVGIAQAVVQGALVGRLVKLFGERLAAIVGLLCGTLGFFLYASANTPAMVFAAIPFSAFFGLTAPSIQSLMSARLGPSEQGQLQGAIGSLMAVAALLGPTLFTETFARAIDSAATVKLPGAPYYIASFLTFVALAVLLLTKTATISKRDGAAQPSH